MFLQHVGNKPPNVLKCGKFFRALMSGDLFSIEVGDFMKKSKRCHDVLSRKYHFVSRCHVSLTMKPNLF